MRRAARKDANHSALVTHWRAIGGSWLDTYQLAGALDGVAGMYGIDQRVEIKDPNAMRGRKQAMELTDAERETFELWRGRAPIIWTCIEDVDETRRVMMRECERRACREFREGNV